MVHFIFITLVPLYVAPVYSYVTRILPYVSVCTRLVLVCTCMLRLCTCMLLVCTRMLLVCTCMLLVCTRVVFQPRSSTYPIFSKFSQDDHVRLQLHLQLYLKNACQYKTQNLSRTVTPKDYNENNKQLLNLPYFQLLLFTKLFLAFLTQIS